MRGTSFVVLLNILSKRLKKNNYNEFFEKMMNFIPNILYELNIKDMNNILKSFYNLDIMNSKVCEIMYPKILYNMDNINDAHLLSSLCYIFYKYNFEHLHFFECLKKKSLKLMNTFDAQDFYKFIFSLYKKNICVKQIMEEKKNDISAFKSFYNEEQKRFFSEICNMN